MSDTENGKKIFSLSAPSRGLIAAAIGVVVLLVALTWLLINFTPLRQTIRGYPNRETREAAIQNRLKVDSLERQISLWAFQVGNIQRVLSGREPIDMDSLATYSGSAEGADIYAAMYAQQDSILRGIVEKETALDLSQSGNINAQLEGINFFTPVKGMITEGYNLAINHPYVEIAADENATVYSILDGTVISAGWNDDTGYVIIVQHNHDLVSVYKHNDRLLKKAGDKIKIGTPIAIVGGTGSLATGVQLHFELWHAGESVDPVKYISF